MNLTREQKALLLYIHALTLTHVTPENLITLSQLLSQGLVQYVGKSYTLTAAGNEMVNKIKTEELQYSKPLSMNRGQLKSIISDCFEKFITQDSEWVLEQRMPSLYERDTIINEAFEEAIEYITIKKKKS